jgi:hypothetical protein
MSDPPSLTHNRRLPRQHFSPIEDRRLQAVVNLLGMESWDAIAQLMPGRTARQCRDRYKNYLLDNVVLTVWTPEEDAKIIQRFTEIGPKWVEIALALNGRSGNQVKNRWHKHLCKKIAMSTEFKVERLTLLIQETFVVCLVNLSLSDGGGFGFRVKTKKEALVVAVRECDDEIR